MNYMKQQTQSKTPDPDAKFLHSLLEDMKSTIAKQKRTFKIGALNLMDELLEDTVTSSLPRDSAGHPLLIMLQLFKKHGIAPSQCQLVGKRNRGNQ
jgi:hypothetical protein